MRVVCSSQSSLPEGACSSGLMQCKSGMCIVASMSHPEHPNLQVLEHPLIQDKLAQLRSVDTGMSGFRALISRIAGLMVFQISRDLKLRPADIETPLETVTGYRLALPVTIIPILRAGLALADGVAALMPDARIGHIGLYRDETSLDAVRYYCKLPEDIDAGPVFLVDPMLATGGSAIAAVNQLLEYGCQDIRLVCMVAAPEGVRAMHDAHPSIPIFTAALDRCLNENGYILPGLGDAGDRMFGTR